MTGSDLSHDLSSPGTPAKREYSLEDEETDLSDSEEVELLRRQLRTRKGGQTALCSTRNVLTALLVGSAGFLLGNISRGTISNAPTSGFYSPLTHGKTGRCNAYQQIGVLQVNLNTSRENKWIPLDSNCTPTGTVLHSPSLHRRRSAALVRCTDAHGDDNRLSLQILATPHLSRPRFRAQQDRRDARRLGGVGQARFRIERLVADSIISHAVEGISFNSVCLPVERSRSSTRSTNSARLSRLDWSDRNSRTI